MYSESGQYVLIGDANQVDSFESDLIQFKNHQVDLNFPPTFFTTKCILLILVCKLWQHSFPSRVDRK